MPLGDDVEVGWDVEQAIEDQWPGLAWKLFQREDAEIAVVQSSPEIDSLPCSMLSAPIKVECGQNTKSDPRADTVSDGPGHRREYRVGALEL